MRHESIPIGPACSREEAPRAEITLLCEVRQGFDPWRLVRLEDISQSGFRIAWLPGATLLKPLRIRIPGLQMLSASIRWQQGKALGCEFAEPLHIAVFQHILAQVGGAQPPR